MTATAYNETLPTLQEELDRKALDTLGGLIMDCRAKRISPAQFEVGINTLFSAVSGLVTSEFIELVTRASKEETNGEDVVHYDRRVFNKGESTVIIVYGFGDELFTISMMRPNRPVNVRGKSFVDQTNAPKKAHAAYLMFAASLESKGYEELT